MAATKTFVMTGVTGAVGGAAAVALAKRGVRLVLSGRDEARLSAAAERVRQAVPGAAVETEVLDLGDLDSVRAGAARIARAHPVVDGLVHVAAFLTRRRVVTKQGLESMFAANHAGPFLLTVELAGALRAAGSPRIVVVSAPSITTLDFADLQGERKFGGVRAFGRTKLANLLFAKELARRFPEARVAAFHPGLVRSELLAEMPAPVRWLFPLFAKSPALSGEALAHVAAEAELTAGEALMFHLRERKPFVKPAEDRDAQAKLWAATVRLVGGDLAPARAA